MTDFNRIELNIPRIKGNEAFVDVMERFLKRPLLIPSVVVFASCILTYISENLIPLCITAVILVTASVYAVCIRHSSLFFCLLVTLPLALTCCLRMNTVLNAKPEESPDSSYSGIVISCERKLSGKTRITVEIKGVRTELRTDEEQDVGNLIPGSSFVASGKFKEPGKAGNPGEFDYPGYLKSKGIRYLFYADSIEVTAKSSGIIRYVLSFPDQCFRMREYLFERFTYGRSKEEKGLLAAVCLGDSSLAGDDVTREFSLSGCSHLLAVSGTHFAGFLAFLPYLLSAICPDRRKTSVLYALSAFAIACVTGWSESVTRAAFMSSTAFAGKDTVSAMSASALIMMITDPFCSCRSGFLLSFSACIAIRLLSGRISHILGFLKDKKKLRSLISAQSAAILGTMPFTGLIDFRFSIVRFAVQAAGGLIAKGVCIMFIPGALLSVLFTKEYAVVFSSPSCLLLGLLGKLVKTGAECVLKTSVNKPLEPVFILSIWLFIVLRLLPSFSVRRKLTILSAGLLALCFGLGVSGFVKPVRAQIVFADVGQGDCCLIIAGNTTCLIDSGTYEKGDKNVSDLLDYYGINSVDIAFMTHWDQDHAGGIAALSKKGRVKQIYTGFTGRDSDTEAFDKSLIARGCDPSGFRNNLNNTKTGDVFKLSDDVILKVIYPENAATGGNPGSLVIVLECCGRSFMFTGDIDSETENILVSQGLAYDVDILKVAHHGSKYSTCSDFLRITKPGISVIQVGRNNLYGHPSVKTVERLNEVQSEIYRTDTDGAVIFEFY